MAAASTVGYFSNNALKSATNVLCGSMARSLLVHKPKRAVFHRKLLNHTCSHGYLNTLNRIENKGFQFAIESVKRKNIAEMAVGLEHMLHLVLLHRPPIRSQTEITNAFQNGYRLCLVINNQSAPFQQINLFHKGDGLLGVSHQNINKLPRPGTLFSGKRGGDYPIAKLRTFSIPTSILKKKKSPIIQRLFRF